MRKTKAIVFVLVLALASCLAVACKKRPAETTPPPAPPADPVYEVALNTSALTLQVGQSAVLIATPVKDGLVDGDAQLAWSSSDDTVASVSAGTVTALQTGNATITVTYQGKTASATVTVEYIEPSIALSYTSLALSPGESETLEVSAAGNITPTSYTWTSSRPEIATVDDDGTVEAVAAGETTVTVSAEIDGETYTDSCVVTVTDKYDITLVVESAEVYFAERAYDMSVTVLRNGVLVDDPAFTVTTNPAGKATYDPATGKLTFEKGVSGDVGVIVSSYGATRTSTVECFIEIKDKASFDQLKDYRDGKFKVTADIDYGGAAFVPGTVATTFTGTVDGQGHVVYNAKLGKNGNEYSAMGAAGSGASVRNLAFAGITGEQRSGGIFANGSGYTVDNCFMEMTYDGNNSNTASGNNPAGILSGKVSGGAVVRNSVTVVTFTQQPTYAVGVIAAKTEATGLVENCYAYVNLPDQQPISTEDSTVTANTHNAEDCGVYTSAAQFAEMDRTDFDADLWDFGTGVVPTFKNAKLKELLTVTPTVNKTEVDIIVGERSKLEIGGKLYEIAADAAGVTVSADGWIDVAAAATPDTTAVVTIRSAFDPARKVEVTVNVLAVPTNTYTLTFTKPSGDLFVGTAYDMPVAITEDGTPLTTDAYEVVVTPSAHATYDKATGKLTINDSGSFTVEMRYLNAHHTETIESWYEIKDKESFDRVNTARSGWFKMTADVDYDNKVTAPSSTGFTGIVDGQGHIVYDLQIGADGNNRSIFGTGGNGGVVRNIGFVGVKATVRSGGIFSYGSGYTIDNCFVETVYDATTISNAVVDANNPVGMLAGKVSGTSVVKNSIAVVTIDGEIPTEFADRIGMLVSKTEGQASSVTNCFAYVNKPNQTATSTVVWASAPNTNRVTGCGVYTTAAQFAELPQTGFKAEIWDFPAGAVPTFKNAKGKELLAVAPVCADTAVDIIVGADKQLQFTGKHYEISLTPAVEGVTVDASGLVTVAANVPENTTFTVSATSIFDATAKASVAFTVKLPSADYTLTFTKPTGDLFVGTAYDMPVTMTKDGDAFSTTDYDVLITPAAAATYDKATGKLTVTGSGNFTVKMSYENAEHTESLAAWYGIATKADFDTYFSKDAVQANRATYLAGWYQLTADIDYAGGTMTPHNIYGAGRFSGIFEGNGHYIKNFTPGAPSGNERSVFGFVNNGVIRNVSFIEVSASNRTGVIAYCIEGSQALIENCFVEVTYNTGDMGSASGNNPAGLVVGKAIGGQVRNCVVVATLTGTAQHSVGMVAGKITQTASLHGAVVNCHVYANRADQTIKSAEVPTGSELNNGEPENCGVYTTVAAFLAGIGAEAFAASPWTRSADALPVFASSKTALAQVPTADATAEIIVGNSLQLVATGEHFEFVLATTAEGVTVSPTGLLTVADTAAADTQVVVSVRSIFDATVKTDITVSLKPVPADVYTITFTKPAGDLFVGTAYDMPMTITKNGAPFETDGYTVTVAPAAAATYDKTTKKLTINDSGDFTVTARVENVDHEESLAGWYEIKDKASFKVTNTKRAGRFKVTADIDYGGDAFDNPSSTAFTGTIDGQGHTVYNAKTSQTGTNLSIFGQAGAGAVVRNLAFVNIQGKERCGGIFAYGSGYLIENCFMEMTYDGNQTTTAPTGNNPAGILAGKVSANAIVRNCVTVVTYTQSPKNSVGAIVAKTEASGKVENCYAYVNLPGQSAISTIDSTNTANTHNAINCGVYTTVAEFLAGIDRTKFTASVWGFPENALPSFDSSASLLAKAPTAAGTAEVVQGSSVQLTATGTYFEYALAAATDGVTVTTAGLVTVADSVAVGTTFTVNAASIFDRDVKSAIEVTVTAPPSSVISVTSEKELHLKLVTGYSVSTSAITASSSGGETLTYTSSAPAVATVDASGVITPVADGTATVTVSIDGSALPVEITVTVDVFTPITTIAEFNAIQTSQNNAQVLTGKYMLMNDIDATSDTTSWISLGNCVRNAKYDGSQGFNGIFDGNGHTVSNLTPLSKAGGGNNVAPFGTIMAGGIVRNLAFVNLTLNNTIAGGIANMNYGTIENCYVDAVFTQFHTGNANPSGGIVAKNNGKVANCIAKVSTTATANLDRFGGIVGGMYNNTNIVEKSFVIGREYMVCPGRINDAGMNAFNKFDTVSKAFADTDAFFAESTGADVTAYDSAIWNIDGTNKTIGLRPGCSFAGTKL